MKDKIRGYETPQVRRQLESKLDELARKYHETGDEKTKREIETLSRRLGIVLAVELRVKGRP